MQYWQFVLYHFRFYCSKEEEARKFFRQMVSAIQFIHANGIAHRDIKPVSVSYI